LSRAGFGVDGHSVNLTRTNTNMQTITEIIADLSIDIACLLDEPSEVTEQDLIKMQDLITNLDNQ